MGGTDDPSNLVELTILDHAIAHKVLYGLYGRWQDKLAWLSLSEQVTEDEARRIRVAESNRTRIRKPVTPEGRAKMAKAHRGKTTWNSGKPATPEHIERNRQAQLRIGNKPPIPTSESAKKSAETRKRNKLMTLQSKTGF